MDPDPRLTAIRAQLRKLRDLGEDLNRGAWPANLAEQIWDACDAIHTALAVEASASGNPDGVQDYSTWLTKQQAAQAIGVSTKTIEKLARDGDISQRFRRNLRTGVRVAVYQPADVARIPRRPGVRPPASVDARIMAGPDVERLFRERKLARDLCRRRTAALVKRGVLVPEPCEQCGASKVHAHHDDYSDPSLIRWLCHLCHHRWHREVRRSAPLPRGTSPTPSRTGGER
jgi:ribosomal protein S27AE